jgi:acetolactate synthase-1/2/3 large subunit
VERARVAAVCVLAGTRMPLLARLGLEGALSRIPVLSLGRGRPFIELGGGVHIEGDIAGLLRAVRVRMTEGPARTPLTAARRADPDQPSQPGAFNSETALSRISSELSEGAVILVDAGNTAASAVHYLRVPRGGRWLLAMGMAGMGYAFGAAVGAACATGRRCLVCAGDGAFFMHGSEIHTAVEHSLPITFVIFNNRAHGMCLLRERLLMREEHHYNSFKPAHVGAGLAALFPGLPAYDCGTLAELDQALARTREAAGPVLLGIELGAVEIPPFAAFASSEPIQRPLLRGDQTS